jgi:hypothetical protein
MNTEWVLEHLLKRWVDRETHLGQFLQDQFGYSLTRPHRFRRLFIAQTSDGDVENNLPGGRFSSKWVFEHGSLRAVPLDYAHREMVETDEFDELFDSPSFLFYPDNGVILLSERYGPRLRWRLRGRISVRESSPTIDWTTVWCWKASAAGRE